MVQEQFRYLQAEDMSYIKSLPWQTRGERLLLAALIDRTVRDLLPDSSDGVSPRMKKEAALWVLRKTPIGRFGFEFACENINLCPRFKATVVELAKAVHYNRKPNIDIVNKKKAFSGNRRVV